MVFFQSHTKCRHKPVDQTKDPGRKNPIQDHRSGDLKDPGTDTKDMSFNLKTMGGSRYTVGKARDGNQCSRTAKTGNDRVDPRACQKGT